MRLCPFKDHGDGVVPTGEVHRGGNRRTPSTVGICRGREQGVPVKLHQQLEADQTVTVNRVKVVKTTAKFPRVPTSGVNAIIEEEGHP